MTSDKTKNLLLTTDGSKVSKKTNKHIENARIKVKNICDSLLLEGTQDYNPESTFDRIEEYMNSETKIPRMLYSEISNCIFSLNMQERGIFSSNLDSLVEYTLNEKNSECEDHKKIVLKIYDHFHLALHQIENARNIFDDNIGEAKKDLQKEMKGAEKEYISILGIFAAIVLAFVGGITFSTSVLENISTVSIYRLLLVVDAIVIAFVNIIYILVKFVLKINGTDNRTMEFFSIKWFNIACIAIAFLIVLAWVIDFHEVQNWVSNWERLPWNNKYTE